jgi:hypothetical protein
MRRGWLTITIAAFAACDQAGPRRAETPADSVATSPDTVPAHPDSAAIQRYRALLPDSVLARRDACPFECCMYGTWVADTAIPMYREPRSNGTPDFTVAKGDSIRAETGVVFVTSIALVVADDTILIGARQRPAVLPGDTLVLLDPIGEGYWTAWRRGEVIREVPPFFESWMPEGKRGRLIGKPDREWWVRGIVNGRAGWFRPDRYHVRGSDACG